jgi:predicted metalloprotease
VSYLRRKGLRNASRIELRLLSGPDTFYCAPVEITYASRGPGPDYCQPTPQAPLGTVVLNARFLSDDVPNLVTTGAQHVPARELPTTELGAAAVVIGHELGHAEQALRRGHTAPLAAVGVELQADCYAGQMVAKAEPRLLHSALQFMRQIPGDARHGSARQRLAEFKRGARGGRC